MNRNDFAGVDTFKMERAIADALSNGWSVVHRSPTTVLMQIQAPHVNHTLHLLLCLLTCFFWLPVWVGIAMAAGVGKNRNLNIYALDDGTVWFAEGHQKWEAMV